MPDKRTYEERREYRLEYEKRPEVRERIRLAKKKRREDPAVREKMNDYNRAWREANTGKVIAAQLKYRAGNLDKRRSMERSYAFMKRYGITEAGRDELLASQGGVCAICASTSSGSKKNWHIDHNHTTGKIRGILCANCNVSLGAARDDISRLRKMIDYLEKHSA
jgi:hypothetical protein